ncbi:hypothetical protein AC579_532 [Pseudocercospora musae]|uniref:FAD-binding PCMH-type domain-containing protein n=1 Tax=Pseudocercospora musae TaxID=113226 RepID=A0A139IR61_9PEZI|nr:hypothetical protein AC579_532 [Pseudocercospora musae]
MAFILLLLGLFGLASTTPLQARSTPINQITDAQWKALNTSVGGRLFLATPYAKPCYTFYNGVMSTPDTMQCKAVQDGYTDEQSIANDFGGYLYPNWGTCQAKAQGCDLDFAAPQNPAFYAPPKNCFQGSIASYYINVQRVSDVQAGLKFASDTGVPLVVKNSGHDFKGRSSAPGSLALWTHNVQPPIELTRGFKPQGCKAAAGDAVTMGAGQGFAGVYQFAEANGITVVGGSSRTVGPVGGWISGGGHGALSNTLGLGVDNILEMQTVLPNGTLITANRCQNQDIFFAIRGGGGSTFGVNWQMTYTAHPQMELEVAYIRFVGTNSTVIRKFIDICTQLGDVWAKNGWGGYIAPGAATTLVSGMILMTPKLSHVEAVTQMKPLTDFVASLGNAALDNSINTESSFYQAYQKYISPNQEKVGVGIAMGSKLVPQSMLENLAGQKAVADAIEKSSQMVVPLAQITNQAPDLMALTYGAPFQILVTAPSSYKTDGTSAVTPAWYSTAWHVCLGQGIANNADAGTISAAFQNANAATQVLRNAVGSPGAYLNEADTFEPDPVNSYWGQTNYNKLMAIKKEVDPRNVLTNWGAIGWDKTDARYGCYPSIS